MPGQCTRSRAEGDGRSDANQCCDMKADLATIGPEATLKRVGVVGPKVRNAVVGSCPAGAGSGRLLHAIGSPSALRASTR